jgi:hypothetical protein
MRRTEVWRNVLIEERRHDGQRAVDGDECNEQLEVALVALVHQVHMRKRIEADAPHRSHERLERRLIVLRGTAGFVTEVGGR